MRKSIFLLIISFTIFSLSTQGQAVSKGDLLWNFGIGMGPTPLATNAGVYPSWNTSLEYMLQKYLSLGGYAGYAMKHNAQIDYNLISVGVVGGFHFWQLISDRTLENMAADKIDVYMNFSMGFKNELLAYSGNEFKSAYQPSLHIGPSVGLRYVPFKNGGFFIEGGKGALGFLTIGGSIRF